MHGFEKNLSGYCIGIDEGFLDVMKEIIQKAKELRRSKRTESKARV